jgi:signal transduction histidine kinase
VWAKLVTWHREWESEMLDVLSNPALAQNAPPGYRRWTALKLAELSTIERQQLRKFSIKYRGWRLYAAIGKLVALFCLAGTLWHLAAPEKFSWQESLVLSNSVGLATLLGLLGQWFNYRRFQGKVTKHILIIILLAVAGAITGASVTALQDGRPLLPFAEKAGRVVVIAGLAVGGVYALMMGVVASWRNREFETLTRQLQLEAERERLARQLSESQLRLLQAQIEPHFLFNTLGAVQQLSEASAPRAAELTANLITFLRASLSGMRAETVTLAEDFALIDAYLKVMKMRLGDRLRFILDLPGPLGERRLPSMMLLTLVENSIKHGIEPSLRGGAVSVLATQLNGAIRLRVQDTGQGMSDKWQFGVGLTNVRDRLQLAYGDTAGFSICGVDAGGVMAEITLPA